MLEGITLLVQKGLASQKKHGTLTDFFKNTWKNNGTAYFVLNFYCMTKVINKNGFSVSKTVGELARFR